MEDQKLIRPVTLLNEIYERYSDMFDLGTVSQRIGGLSLSYKGSDFLRLVNNENNENIKNESESKSSPTSPRDSIMKLITIGLTHKSITEIGDQNELELCCPNLIELDISYNKINNWNEIRKLLCSIKKLRLLNLKSNDSLSKYYTNEENDQDSIKSEIEQFKLDWSLFENVTLSTLILNSCNVNLRIIQLLVEKLVNLNELHLSSNDYENVNFSNDFSKQSLKLLYFNNNKLKDWNDVCKLGKSFPNLEYLCISENSLSDIERPESIIEPLTDTDLSNIDIKNSFLKLNTIVLNKLNIKDWKTIYILRDELNELNNVRVQNIPLLENFTNDEKYFLLVSSLGEKITTLNGSQIKKEERETCERQFIRYYTDLPMKPKRYNELVLKHGILNNLADVDLKMSEQCQVKIKFQQIYKYVCINIKQTVEEFKKSLEQFVGHKIFKFNIFYLHYRHGLIKLDEHTYNKQLILYKIRDGDEFQIKLKSFNKKKSLNEKDKYEISILFEDKKYSKIIDSRQTIGEFKRYLENVIHNPAKKMQLFHLNKKTNQMSEELKLMNKNLVSLNLSNGDEFKILLKK